MFYPEVETNYSFLPILIVSCSLTYLLLCSRENHEWWPQPPRISSILTYSGITSDAFAPVTVSASPFVTRVTVRERKPRTIPPGCSIGAARSWAHHRGEREPRLRETPPPAPRPAAVTGVATAGPGGAAPGQARGAAGGCGQPEAARETRQNRSPLLPRD